ncbi:hypothetical protein BD769DRAFT_1682524 [Suillus cothurnatus]|nr:hypothetical protein BD769DRAFT_1682524 [Suillus cothurnatus]
MSASGSMQQSEKPNSSPEPPQAEPPVSGWPEWVGTWPTWGTDEDDQARKDKLSEAEQSKIDWDWEAIYEWEKEWLKMLAKRSTS